MAIYKDLVQKALSVLDTKEVTLHRYEMDHDLTYVVIEYKKNFYTGLTVSPKKEGSDEKIVFNDINEILTQSLQYSTTKRAYGLASINALGQILNAQEKIKTNKNLRQTILNFLKTNVQSDDKIVFVGHLKPVVNALKTDGYNTEVFCRQKTEEKKNVYNDIFEYEAIENAQIIVITAASLQGSTIDAILKFTQKAKIVMLAGFSAGGYVQWYKNLGFTHLASLQVENDTDKTNFENIFENPSYLVKL